MHAIYIGINYILFKEFIMFIIHKKNKHSSCSTIQQVHDKLSIKSISKIKHTRILILKKSCLATSYVTATFHPTIGERAHQSLNTTATPKLGMIYPRNKEH